MSGVVVVVSIITLPWYYEISAQRPDDQTLHEQTLQEIVKQTKDPNSSSSQINVGQKPVYIGLNIDKNIVYVTNAGSDTVSVINGNNNSKIKDIPVGNNPQYIAFSLDKNTGYVTNYDSGTVSVINGNNNSKIKDIPVGINPQYIAFSLDNTVYVTNAGSRTVSVINGNNNSKIKDIPVGFGPANIDINQYNKMLYVVNSFSDTVSVINGNNNSKIKDIPVGKNPQYISVDPYSTDKVYVTNAGSDTVSVINGNNNSKIKDIPVGKNPQAIAFSPDKITVYVTNAGSRTVSVINGNNNSKIKDIPVGKNPQDIAVNPYSTDKVYVTNAGSDTVSVINGNNNSKIKDIPVGNNPQAINLNYNTKTVYVANSGSDSISVIDGESDNLVARVRFNIDPSNSGYIICNNIDTPINQYLYVSSGTTCTATPNKGFEFSSWVENLKQNSTRNIKTSTSSDSQLKSFLNTFGIISNDTGATFNVTRFGTFTANFRALPAPIPAAYWIPLYGVIVSSIVGWSIPSIIRWISSKKQRRMVLQYHKRIGYLYDDRKLDENDVESLDRLNRDIEYSYANGKLTEQHYVNLKNEISTLYEQVYKKRIDLLNGKLDSSRINGTILDNIRNDITDAYANGKLTEAAL